MGNTISSIIGKRIKQALFLEGLHNSKHILLIFSDLDYCLLSSSESSIKVRAERIDDPELKILTEGFKIIEKYVFDEDGSHKKHVSELFHGLWTKAANMDGYDKATWRELRKILNDSGVEV